MPRDGGASRSLHPQRLGLPGLRSRRRCRCGVLYMYVSISLYYKMENKDYYLFDPLMLRAVPFESVYRGRRDGRFLRG